MKKDYWFRQKTYGYGVTPCSWQGWLVTLGLVIVLVAMAHYFFGGKTEPGLGQVLTFLASVLIISVIFLRLTKAKTKGELGWRWGKKDIEKTA